MSARKDRLNEKVHLNTQNIYFDFEIRKLHFARKIVSIFLSIYFNICFGLEIRQLHFVWHISDYQLIFSFEKELKARFIIIWLWWPWK